jgi:hypothetical protein
MRKLFNFLIVGFAFVALNVGTVAAQTGMTQPPVTDGMPSCAATSPDFVDNGVCDGSAGSAPMGDAEESGGPAGQHMNREINDGGFGANSGADAEKARIAAEAQAAEAAAKEEEVRLAAEAAAKEEEVRLAAEAAAEAAAKEEEVRLAAEAAAKEEEVRLAAEAAAKEEQAQNSCKVTLNEIDVRTFRNCKSAEERVDTLRGYDDSNRAGSGLGPMNPVCPSSVGTRTVYMWHNKYEEEDINALRDRHCRARLGTTEGVGCLTALKDLELAMEAFNDKAESPPGTHPGRGFGCAGTTMSCGGPMWYDGECPCVGGGDGYEKNGSYRGRLVDKLMKEKTWWKSAAVATVNKSWQEARDACAF